MKYIRTKDEIKEYDDTCDLSYVYQSIGGIKVANTIEELCDEFVSVYERYQDHWDNLEECLRLCWDGGAEIYGAIWTDKGLIYVAKMNDKGKLELI